MRHLWAIPISWLLLPLVFVAMMIMWIMQQFRNVFHKRNKTYWEGEIHVANIEPKVDELLGRSPLFTNDHYDMYCLRVPLGHRPDGNNHNTDHGCSRQGVYAASLKKYGLDNHKASETLRFHLAGKELYRGYHLTDGYNRNYNHQPVSGDMLIGYCLGYVFSNNRMFDLSMFLLSNELCRHTGLLTRKKISPRADFAPGINLSESPIPVGAQDLTYLVGIKAGIVAGEKLAMDTTNLKDEYFLRFWVYGGFIRMLFPTAGIWFKRGYSNDNNAIMAAYTLFNLSHSWSERTVYKLSMLWTWSLAWPWLNGFHAGMLSEGWDKMFPTKMYMKRCARYAVDMLKINGECDVQTETKSVWPSPILQNSQAGEFICDEDQEVARYGKPVSHSTLGQLACLIWSKRD